MPMYREWGEQL